MSTNHIQKHLRLRLKITFTQFLSNLLSRQVAAWNNSSFYLYLKCYQQVRSYLSAYLCILPRVWLLDQFGSPKRSASRWISIEWSPRISPWASLRSTRQTKLSRESKTGRNYSGWWNFNREKKTLWSFVF